MTTAPTNPPKTGTAALDELFAAANRSHAPGLVVGVAHRGRTVYRRGFGLASLEHAVANTPSTRMRVASITKQFTCFAALLLAEEGRLDLDAPVNGLLPELPRLDGWPTPRQLMHHTGGLHDAWDLHFMARGLMPTGDGLALRAAARQTAANFAPGCGQLYSNTGYALLSTAIERASGMGFEAFLRARVFEPLGMRDTESVPSDLMIVPGLATMHQALPDGSWRRGIGSGNDNTGAGAAVSTIDDLLTWLAQLRGPKRHAGSDATWRTMTEPAMVGSFRTSYACGLIRNRYRGVEVLHHGGSLIGVAAQAVTVPEHELDVAIIANCELFNPVELGWQVIDAMLGDALGEPRPPFATSERFAHLFGTRWHADSGMLVGFDDAGGRLGFSFFHSPPIPMLEDLGDRFSLGGGGAGPYVFSVADLLADGRAPDQLTMTDAGQPIVLRRLPATPPPTLRTGERLVGRWHAADLAANARVEIENGATLVLHIDTEYGARSAELQALSDTVFGVAVRDPVFPARYALTVDAEGFRLDGGRSRHVRFRPA